MRIKNHLNLFDYFNDNLKTKIINKFLEKSIPFVIHNISEGQPISKSIRDDYLSEVIDDIRVDSVIFSIKVLLEKEDSKTEYKEIIKYKYNIDKGILKGTLYDLLKYSDKFFINEHPLLKYEDWLKREFYSKINDKNITIERIKGIFIRLTYITSASTT